MLNTPPWGCTGLHRANRSLRAHRMGDLLLRLWHLLEVICWREPVDGGVHTPPATSVLERNAGNCVNSLLKKS